MPDVKFRVSKAVFASSSMNSVTMDVVVEVGYFDGDGQWVGLKEINYPFSVAQVAIFFMANPDSSKIRIDDMTAAMGSILQSAGIVVGDLVGYTA